MMDTFSDLMIHEHKKEGLISFALNGKDLGVVDTVNPEQLAPIFIAMFSAGVRCGITKTVNKLESGLEGKPETFRLVKEILENKCGQYQTT